MRFLRFNCVFILFCFLLLSGCKLQTEDKNSDIITNQVKYIYDLGHMYFERVEFISKDDKWLSGQAYSSKCIYTFFGDRLVANYEDPIKKEKLRIEIIPDILKSNSNTINATVKIQKISLNGMPNEKNEFIILKKEGS